MENRVSTNEREESQRDGARRFGRLVNEVKLLSYIAGPMVVVNLSHYFLQVISIMMVGHLGELYLSSTAIAISFGAVTGFSVLFGMAGALETLSGQAYGAQQYRILGIQTNTAIFCLILLCLPLSLLWIYMGKLLVLMGQDPIISREAGKFMLWLIPALFAYATLQPLVKYFQTQSLTIPLLLSSCATICCHVPLCWALVFKSGLKTIGATLSIGISYWLNVILLVLYMKCSPACESTRAPISSEIFRGFGEFLWFASPSAVMLCGGLPSCLLCFQAFYQIQSSRLQCFLYGIASITTIQYAYTVWISKLNFIMRFILLHKMTAAFALLNSLSTISTLYAIPESLGAAGSTRVSNELGANNPRAARLACGAVMFLTVLQAIIISSIILASRSAFGYIFTNDKEVVDYTASMAPLLCVSVIFLSFSVVLSGIVRGCGAQKVGAFVNLGSYYLFGIPIAAVLAFRLQLRGKGLWIGYVAGSFLQAFLLSMITICTNWKEKARIARERIFKETSPGDIGLTEQSTLH